MRKAHRIVVLKSGKEVVSGTHDSLIAVEGGVYAGLVYAQALTLGEPSEPAEIEHDHSSDDLIPEKEQAQSKQTEEALQKEETKNRTIIQSFCLFF